MSLTSLLRSGGSGRIPTLIIGLVTALPIVQNPAPSLAQSSTSPRARQTSPSANMDFLSDAQFQSLTADERRRMLRGAWLARIEPTGEPSADRLQDYVDRIKQAVVYDARLTVFDLKASRIDGTTNGVSLTGEVLLDSFAHGVADTLGQLGFAATTSSVRVLPDGSLKADGAYAIVTRSGGATMRRSPRIRAEQINEVPMGASVRLLRAGEPKDLPQPTDADANSTSGEGRRNRRGGERGPGRGVSIDEVDSGPETWFLTQSTEGYVGYLRAQDLHRTETLFRPTAILIHPTTATLAGDHPTSAGQFLPLAAGTFLTQIKAESSAPESGYGTAHPASTLPQEAVVRPIGRTPITESELRTMLVHFVGKPYEWGGTSSDGIDCSGLTQFIYRALGIQLPRDAEEQAIVGKIIAWGEDAVDAAQPGDLVFFTNARGRVSHVAVSLGGGIIAHAHERSVKIEPLRKVVDRGGESLADRILFARRIAGQ